MMTRQKTVWLALLLIGLYTDFLNASEIMRWMIASSDSICWKVNGAHNDHIEMSGLKVSTVLRYGVNEAGEWVIDRNMVLLFVLSLMIPMVVYNTILMGTGHIYVL